MAEIRHFLRKPQKTDVNIDYFGQAKFPPCAVVRALPKKVAPEGRISLRTHTARAILRIGWGGGGGGPGGRIRLRTERAGAIWRSGCAGGRAVRGRVLRQKRPR